jgi:rhamnosyltransferase
MINKVEILMATYNGEKYLEEQINSIIKQSYENWNLLIRDDNSTDKTKIIIKNYSNQDKRIKLIHDNEGNLGFVKNFEELLKHSKENYVMFSDQDDVWEEKKIEIMLLRMINLEKENPEKPILLHCNSYVCDSNLNIKKNFFISKIAKQNNFKNMFFNFIVQGSGIMMNKKLADISLPFLKDVYLHDRYLHILAELLGQRDFIDVSLNYYRQHGQNQIGAKGSNILGKIFYKNYYTKEDRKLISTIYKFFLHLIDENKKESIRAYFEITSKRNSRLKRLYLIKKYKINMSLKKKLFLLLKG